MKRQNGSKEIMLEPDPVKMIVKENNIELWIKRYKAEWVRVVSIKLSKACNNLMFPWSVRYYEEGSFKYKKFCDFEAVRANIAYLYLVDIPNEVSTKFEAKILMNKISKS